LLGYSSVEQISRYERSSRIPSLSTAIKLELIYGLPVRYLFADLTDRVMHQLQKQMKSHRSLRALYPELSASLKRAAEFCSCDEKLKKAALSDSDKEIVRKHIVTLARRLHGLVH